MSGLFAPSAEELNRINARQALKDYMMSDANAGKKLHNTITPENLDELYALVALLALLQVNARTNETPNKADADAIPLKNLHDPARTNTQPAAAMTWRWLDVLDDTLRETANERLSNLINNPKQSINTTKLEAERTNFKEKITAMQGLGGQFNALKADIEAKGLGHGWWFFKEAVVWLFLLLFAGGCGLSVMGGLLSKFFKNIVTGSPWLLLILPSFGMISVSSFFTNIKIMKADVEGFVDPWFYPAVSKAKILISWGAWWAKKCKQFMLSVASFASGAAFALMTWNYVKALTFLPLGWGNPIAITVAIATFGTEAMLSYGLIENYWLTLFKPWTDGSGRAVTPWGKIHEKYTKLSLARKILFWTGLALGSALILFGLTAVGMVGVGALAHISWLASMPKGIGIAMVAMMSLSQLPMYLTPLCHMLCPSTAAGGSNKSAWQAFKNFFHGIITSHTIQALWQNKFKLSLYTLICSMIAALILLGSVGTLQATALPMVIGFGFFYACWAVQLLHRKGLPQYVRVASNAAGNGALADIHFMNDIPGLGAGFQAVPGLGPAMACGADFFNSYTAGLYGEKDTIETVDECEGYANRIYNNITSAA